MTDVTSDALQKVIRTLDDAALEQWDKDMANLQRFREREPLVSKLRDRVAQTASLGEDGSPYAALIELCQWENKHPEQPAAPPKAAG